MSPNTSPLISMRPWENPTSTLTAVSISGAPGTSGLPPSVPAWKAMPDRLEVPFLKAVFTVAMPWIGPPNLGTGWLPLLAKGA